MKSFPFPNGFACSLFLFLISANVFIRYSLSFSPPILTYSRMVSRPSRRLYKSIQQRLIPKAMASSSNSCGNFDSDRKDNFDFASSSSFLPSPYSASSSSCPSPSSSSSLSTSSSSSASWSSSSSSLPGSLISSSTSVTKLERNIKQGEGGKEEKKVEDVKTTFSDINDSYPMEDANHLGSLSMVNNIPEGSMNAIFPLPLPNILFRGNQERTSDELGESQKNSNNNYNNNNKGDDQNFYIQRMNKEELNICTDICVESFFGEATNPIRKLQLQTLFEEQQQDLKSRLYRPPNKHAMLTCVDLSNQNVNIICGFAEVGLQPGTRHLGPEIPEADERPTIANLAVRPEYRQQGLGNLLMNYCEKLVQEEWGRKEIILQVEEENEIARDMYKKLGYAELFKDNGARKYDISSKFGAIKSVRTTKITMRKELTSPLLDKNLLSSIFGGIKGGLK